MAERADVRRIALELPKVDEGTSYGNLAWKVGGKGFVWERPLGPRDRTALGAAAPDGPVLAARVADQGVKEALLADEPDVLFSIPHFDGYPAVLIRLDRAPIALLRELIVEAWLVRAPKRLATAYLDEVGSDASPSQE